VFVVFNPFFHLPEKEKIFDLADCSRSFFFFLFLVSFSSFFLF